MNKKIKPEIVAPAGNTECFSTALSSGTDAVYVGAADFNMRAGAERFGFSEIHRMTERAHDTGTRLYCALNVIVCLRHSQTSCSWM